MNSKVRIGIVLLTSAILILAGVKALAAGTEASAEDAPTFLDCLPDPLGLDSGERSFGEIVDEAIAHSLLGRVAAAISGGEQPDLALPKLNLLPRARCFGTDFDSEAAAAPRE